jgi:hypothetical protein
MTRHALEVAHVAIFVQRVVESPETRLSLWTGQTGHFMVLADGIVASDDGDTTIAQRGSPFLEGLWRERDPELRQGSWTVHAPGRVKEFALPEPIASALPKLIDPAALPWNHRRQSGGTTCRWVADPLPGRPGNRLT